MQEHTVLVDRAIHGDPEALTELLEVHGPEVRRRIRKLMAGRYQSLVDEDDVMQETYAEAFVGIHRYDPRGPFAGWLFRIAKNNLIDVFRGLQSARRQSDARREPAATEDQSRFQFDALFVDSGTSPSGAAARSEVRSVVVQAVADLPPSYREVVSLYDLAGKSAAEIARELHCSEGAVHMRRARAHQFLREMLANPADPVHPLTSGESA